MTMSEGGEKKSGSMIGSIIVVLILIIGAIYLVASRGEVPLPTSAPADILADEPAPPLNTNDELPAIENDAMTPELKNLDQELNQLNREVDNLGQDLQL